MNTLDQIVEEFRDLEPRERLELLAEFADNLPELPDPLRAERDSGRHRVHECQTPVFLWVSVTDGRVEIQADVAPEAPTVKGFVSILVEGLSGSAPDEVLAVTPDLFTRMGLDTVLGMTRSRGLHAILHRIKSEVRAAIPVGVRG